MAPPHPKKLRIGVMLESVQLSDIVGIDLFGNLSKEYMEKIKGLEPTWEVLEPLAIDIEFLYIATTLEPGFMTPSLHFVPTVTYDGCPRNLDIIITGGPLLSHRPAQADRFM